MDCGSTYLPEVFHFRTAFCRVVEDADPYEGAKISGALCRGRPLDVPLAGSPFSPKIFCYRTASCWRAESARPTNIGLQGGQTLAAAGTKNKESIYEETFL